MVPAGVSVALSRTRSNLSDPEDATEANEGNEAIRSGAGLASRQFHFVTFVTFCSNSYDHPTFCAVFTQLRRHRRQSVKPVALSRTQSNLSDPEDATEANEGNEAIRSGAGLAYRQFHFVTFVTFCSNSYHHPTFCAVFTQLRRHRRQWVKPVALSRTQSNLSNHASVTGQRFREPRSGLNRSCN